MGICNTALTFPMAAQDWSRLQTHTGRSHAFQFATVPTALYKLALECFLHLHYLSDLWKYFSFSLP